MELLITILTVIGFILGGAIALIISLWVAWALLAIVVGAIRILKGTIVIILTITKEAWSL